MSTRGEGETGKGEEKSMAERYVELLHNRTKV